MRDFVYLQPRTLAEAMDAWRPGAAYMGGGTNLVDLMKTGALSPHTVIDITRLPDLDRIQRLPDGRLRIGALVRNSDLAHDPEVADAAPMLVEALLSGASGQLRNAATVGGNLLQRTRCPYFADPYSACNQRMPGAGCSAIGGETHNHAILGWTDECIATNPSDFCVPLAALGAVVQVRGANGLREIPIDAVHQPPGLGPAAGAALEPGDLVLAVILPTGFEATRAHSRYLKVRERTSFAFALTSAAVGLGIKDGVITLARIALGGVAMKPWRDAAAEDLLVGRPPETASFERAAEAVIAGARPSGENGYKIELARRTVIRALMFAAAGTPLRTPALPASPHGDFAHA
ncbi:xanthine dehydrogenase YagS FAD-binding subunit [Poseidonocella pacifica]|uniref:Xanthine dehydrogenase YagS FAD-binding subunit n=1 Tax=Poseidonocella pacifica TaxID=871651 RepID=A0A1I0XBF5_9RHOB|nr:xanthine dehydrogenase family protein subunit M [Poseidonocella pacifica]SFA98419.1 xanthine dehydrogenase YagS FAD-binding subunit [Poseidonocella pacifica]